MVTRLIWSNDRSHPPDAPTRGSPDDADNLGYGWRAVRAGEAAPDFRLSDQHGRRVTLSGLMRRGAVVLRFCRNTNTAACIREFNSLSALHNNVEHLSASLVIIAVEPFDPLPLGRTAASFPFPILSDKEGKVARSYGLTHQVLAPAGPEANGSDDNPKRRRKTTMSAPATYVIDQTGLIAVAFVDVACQILMDHDQILRTLECLGKRK
jgi:peroxiredoxin